MQVFFVLCFMTPTPSPILRPLAPETRPRYSGLQRDERGVVVGAQALVILRTALQRAAFLSALSHTTDLSTGVEVEQPYDNGSDKGRIFLLTLTPPGSTRTLSRFYDTLHSTLATANLGAGRALLCVGDGRIFVPYADAAAPHGYDISGTIPERERIAVLPDGVQSLPAVQPADTLPALLAAPLQPALQPRVPTTLSVLTDRRLAPLVARYIQRHGLDYVARFFVWQHTSRLTQVALFDIAHTHEMRPIPGFVGDFLQRLPRTLLLQDMLEQADLETEPPRRVLVAWHKRVPFYLPHVQHLLPTSALLIVSGTPWGWTIINTPPPRQPMHNLIDTILPAASIVTLSTHLPEPLQLPLALHRSPERHHVPVQALLLDTAALQRLRRIVHRLPAALLPHASIVLGDEVAFLMSSDPQSELEGLPLGYPLTRSEPSELLLPRGMRLLPSLSLDLLSVTLDLQPDTLTVLTPTRRYDIPVQAFVPLIALLTLDLPRQTVPIKVQPVALPPINLDDLDDTRPVPPTPQPTRPERQPTPEATPRPRPLEAERTEQNLSFEQELRQRAAQLERAGDDEIAAAFYTYLKDNAHAAACYRRLLRQETP